MCGGVYPPDFAVIEGRQTDDCRSKTPSAVRELQQGSAFNQLHKWYVLRAGNRSLESARQCPGKRVAGGVMEDSQSSASLVESQTRSAPDGLSVIELKTKPEGVVPPLELSSSDRYSHAYHRLLVVSDLVALLISTVVTLLFLLVIGRSVDNVGWAMAVLIMSPAWILLAYLIGLYAQVERRLNLDYVSELMPVIVCATIWSWLVVIVRALMVDGYTEVITSAAMWTAVIPAILLCRSVARSIARTRPWYRRSIALIGDAGTVDVLNQRIRRHPDWGLSVDLEVVRFDGIQSWQVRRPSTNGGLVRVGSIESVTDSSTMAVGLTALVEDEGIDRAMIAGGIERLSARAELVHTMVNRGIAVDYVSGGPETLYSRAMPQHLEGISLMSSRPTFPRPVGAFIKRCIDVILSAGFLIVTSPLLIISAIAIKVESKGQVIFRQPRMGADGETFQVCKLRTMGDGADDLRDSLWDKGMHGSDGGMLKIRNDPRVTRVGKHLRSWSLDEIPQFWNVLKGDMSIVGPRPLPLDEASKIDCKYDARKRVRPGITGPWQVMGRSEIPMEDMLKLDCTYVTGWSLGEDLRIVLRTIPAVTGKSGSF